MSFFKRGPWAGQKQQDHTNHYEQRRWNVFGSDYRQWKHTKPQKKPVKIINYAYNVPLYDWHDVMMEVIEHPDPLKSKLIVRVAKIDCVEVYRLADIILAHDLQAEMMQLRNEPVIMRRRVWAYLVDKGMFIYPHETLKYSF